MNRESGKYLVMGGIEVARGILSVVEAAIHHEVGCNRNREMTANEFRSLSVSDLPALIAIGERRKSNA